MPFYELLATHLKEQRKAELLILVQADAVTTHVSYVAFTQRVLQSGRCYYLFSRAGQGS